jgi:hypothetical protein
MTSFRVARFQFPQEGNLRTPRAQELRSTLRTREPKVPRLNAASRGFKLNAGSLSHKAMITFVSVAVVIVPLSSASILQYFFCRTEFRACRSLDTSGTHFCFSLVERVFLYRHSRTAICPRFEARGPPDFARHGNLPFAGDGCLLVHSHSLFLLCYILITFATGEQRRHETSNLARLTSR